MIARLRTDDRLRSALRFAVGLTAADAAALPLFGAGATAVMAAFAVIVQLYFLDFDGTWRGRLGGQAVATAVGVLAVLLGMLVAPTDLLAVGVAFLVVFVLSAARVLRGRVARSTVGLAAVFFWLVLIPTGTGKLGATVLAWLLGCAIAMVVGLVVLPRRPSERVCTALGAWLRAAAGFTRALVRETDLERWSHDLHAAAVRLRDESRRAPGALGSVGRRQRAIGEMVSRALWAQPVVARITPDACRADAALAEATATAFEEAATLTTGGPTPVVLPVRTYSKSMTAIAAVRKATCDSGS